MNATIRAARRLRDGNPVGHDTFASAADDDLGRATFQRIIASPARSVPRPRRSSRWLLVLPAVAVTAAAVVLLTVLLPASSARVKPRPELTKPLHTAWQPERPLPDTPVAGDGPAGNWRLVSYLVNQGWQRNTTGPEPGWLTCPTAATCYVQGDNAASAGGPSNMDSLYISTDGAVSWDVLQLPAGLAFLSAMSCASSSTCAAGALYHGQPVFAATTDGAHSWTIDPLPAGDSQIFQLSCPTTTTCFALAAANAIMKVPVVDRYYSPSRLLVTTDGGAHFTADSLPGYAMQDVSCPTSTDCVAIGVRSRLNLGIDYVAVPGAAEVTDDGGATWSLSTLPQGLGDFPELSCVDAIHCYTLGDAVWPGHQYNDINDIMASADGGHTWAVRPLPGSVPIPNLDGLACASDSTCYATGTENVPQGMNADTPMVLITHDSGVTWSRVTFATPSTSVQQGANAESFITIGDIQCPGLGSCVALGGAAQGAKSTPVYSTGVP
jgi:hypothetical protein